jgi:hypothetical protein
MVQSKTRSVDATLERFQANAWVGNQSVVLAVVYAHFLHQEHDKHHRTLQVVQDYFLASSGLSANSPAPAQAPPLDEVAIRSVKGSRDFLEASFDSVLASVCSPDAVRVGLQLHADIANAIPAISKVAPIFDTDTDNLNNAGDKVIKEIRGDQVNVPGFGLGSSSTRPPTASARQKNPLTSFDAQLIAVVSAENARFSERVQTLRDAATHDLDGMQSHWALVQEKLETWEGLWLRGEAGALERLSAHIKTQVASEKDLGDVTL